MSGTITPVRDKVYLQIAAALACLTLVSYVADLFQLPKTTTVLVVLAVAAVKASLVAMFFMHLRFDWGKVQAVIVPVLVLSAVLVVGLLPDIGLRSSRVAEPAAAGPSSPSESPP